MRSIGILLSSAIMSLDAQGVRIGCAGALNAARRMYVLIAEQLSIAPR